uniref:Uncharacterized protein n=1 Tax=Tetranychus urticae TaxID=32264 RepID=A0A158P5F0_TETUR
MRKTIAMPVNTLNCFKSFLVITWRIKKGKKTEKMPDNGDKLS